LTVGEWAFFAGKRYLDTFSGFEEAAVCSPRVRSLEMFRLINFFRADRQFGRSLGPWFSGMAGTLNG
jgi:hypothetical protein